MLKHRLFYGTLMIIGFTAIILMDGWLDGSLTTTTPDKAVQGTVFCILVAILMIPGQFELAAMASSKDAKVLLPAAVIGSIVIATYWYWKQWAPLGVIHFALAIALSLFFTLFWQYWRYGNSNVLTNCGVTYLAIGYLGLLGGFAVAIRTAFGIWPFMMFVAVVKCSDIGAYSVGKLCGKHKFSPRISPGKTWEGMAGACGAAAIVAVLFANICDIMGSLPAVLFGVAFAFVGQMGDLAESMMKRDAGIKDSASKVPGFGGVLDIMDSPLAVAPFAYVFLSYVL